MEGIKELKGNLLESYARVKIFEGFPHNLYEVSSPAFSKAEKNLAELFIKVISRKGSINEFQDILSKAQMEEFRHGVINLVDSNALVQRLPKTEQLADVKAALLALVKQLAKHKVSKPKQFVDFVLSNTIGYGPISEMMGDDSLEEIMINGYDRNVFVFHKQHGMCKTNVIAREHGFALQMIMRIASTVGKQFNEANPLLDARLPDGSRANATFSYVTPFGHSLTIRKFSKFRLSIIHLIENKTLNSEVAAFLWAMAEGLKIYPLNIIVSGGTGTGKTTLLNILSGFISYRSRIVSIEDTLELDLGRRQNWIQMESRPKLKEVAEVKMNDLLKNALRMRPDRIIVGEVRGPEAQTLFVAMDTGHRGILGTLHSNTAREMMLRLKSKPMSVPDAMLPLLNLIVVMQRTYDRDKGVVRRIKQVAEVGRMDATVLLNNIYELDNKSDEIKKTDVPSKVVEELATVVGMTKNELKREILVRQKILEWLLIRGVKESFEVESIIQQYYFDPSSVLEQITSGF